MCYINLSFYKPFELKIICINYFQSHKNDIKILQVVNSKIVDLNTIVSKVLDLAIYNENLYGKEFNLNDTIS